MTSRTVAIVVAANEVVAAMILEFLLNGQAVELSSEGELSINLLLGDVEVLHIEEALGTVRFTVWGCFSVGMFKSPTNFGDSMFKLLDQLLLAARLVELAEVKGNQVRPVHCPISAS